MNKIILNKKYRSNGVVGAILDEYERAVNELQKTISTISETDLVAIVDNETKDSDCKSIQTILTHVISSGFCYVVEIRNFLGEQIDFVERKTLDSVEQYYTGLGEMLKYSEKLFDDYPKLKLEETDSHKKILARWGQQYDVEQLFEHAIVHVLRHRRQIEKFITKLR